jgi:hypothetical protein
MIIEGAKNEEEAYGFYAKLVIEEFEIPPETIDGTRNGCGS